MGRMKCLELEKFKKLSTYYVPGTGAGDIAENEIDTVPVLWGLPDSDGGGGGRGTDYK